MEFSSKRDPVSFGLEKARENLGTTGPGGDYDGAFNEDYQFSNTGEEALKR